MSRRGASPFSVAQRPLRAGRATKPARFYDEVRDRDGAAREENRQRQGADEAREFFFSFFFAGPFSRPQALPQEKAFGSPLPRSSPLISTSHQQEDRLAPVTRVELGKLKVRRLFWRRAEPRTKQGERDLIVVDRESERERQGRRRQARESRAVAGALGFRAPLNLGPPRRQNPLFSPPKIQIGALRRYAAVFGLDVSGTCTRDELTRAIARHWDEQASFLFPFFFSPPPACPLLFLLARFLSFFLPLFFLSPSPLLFFCFLFFQTFERA